MGEAKRRGTFEERKAEGEAKRLERIRVESELMVRRGKSRIPAMMAVALGKYTVAIDGGSFDRAWFDESGEAKP